mmetsp:Transcript_22789/g.53192  ORF Transcript_22789/g.53192 Transcript_22789/m.53192 type:complete len:200 (+) Transcript_22789:188-787(+)
MQVVDEAKPSASPIWMQHCSNTPRSNRTKGGEYPIEVEVSGVLGKTSYVDAACVVGVVRATRQAPRLLEAHHDILGGGSAGTFAWTAAAAALQRAALSLAPAGTCRGSWRPLHLEGRRCTDWRTDGSGLCEGVPHLLHGLHHWVRCGGGGPSLELTHAHRLWRICKGDLDWLLQANWDSTGFCDRFPHRRRLLNGGEAD